MQKEDYQQQHQQQLKRSNMSLTVKINQLHLGKAKANLIARVEFRGEMLYSNFQEIVKRFLAARNFIKGRMSAHDGGSKETIEIVELNVQRRNCPFNFHRFTSMGISEEALILVSWW